jgi:hypothetical protein
MQSSSLELVNGKAEAWLPISADTDGKAFHRSAAELAQSSSWLPSVRSSQFLNQRWRVLAARLTPVLRALHGPLPKTQFSDDFRWLHDNVSLLSTELENTRSTLKSVRRIPHVQTIDGEIVPRVWAVAEALLAASDYQFSETTFTSYVEAFQECTPLDMAELWVLASAMRLVLLEQIAVRALQLLQNIEGSHGTGVCIRSLRDIGQTSWKEVIEPLILFDLVLRKDPTGDYPRMDFDSRNLYRTELANIAEHSDFTEQEVASAALALAQKAQQETYADPREARRCSHIGYYLAAEGVGLLHQEAGFRAPLGQRVSSFLKQHPDELYLPAITGLTFALISAIVLLLTEPNSPPLLILFTMLVLLLPCSQSAVQVVNHLITSLLKPRILPKIDFSDGIPADCLTLVAVPTLLLNEKQVRKLVEDLEVRSLGNHDRNLHFALLTDLPDSPVPPREDDPLIDLCSSLISDLNEKYSGQGIGSFFLFHRHRVYNPRERMWMGWERKRGKLLDLNKLLRGEYDSFPVKAGDVSILPKVRFVITLDADTELPRGSAHRMIGALAHPLNLAIIDPNNNIVVAGYGILQPRVGVSVQSAARSRLARIYSGQSGLDIYTHAVSDVYQDLYGEGTFAGKGIYEVDVLLQVLDGRFPCNALLSHDLIEGAYARSGLAGDIEIIEEYPSHYRAYNCRKHRWLRGDWQIVEWLSSQVPGGNGTRVPNPITLISQWKILDNLRRSLVEPATFLLLVLGWLLLPGLPRFWTLATIAILFVPAWCRFLFAIVRAILERSAAGVRDAINGLFAANVTVFLSLTFLAHQMLLSIDAMIRTLVRRTITRRRLLQWQTAAEAENGEQARTPLDIYLDWTPALALAVGFLVWLVRRSALSAALPILMLWAASKLVSVWLNLPPSAQRNQALGKDRVFLRGVALLTWRYFAEFSTEEHNWLIPDNVQQEKPLRIAPRVSPTNLGLLLNARQVACRFGYLTVPEFAEHTQRTLATIAKLQRYRGHLFNWYDTRTLEPLAPFFVSSVDSGNLVASLWTLAQGSLDQLRQPVVQSFLVDGLLDHLRILMDRGVLSRKVFSNAERTIKTTNWLQGILNWPDAALEEVCAAACASRDEEAQWFAVQAHNRLKHLKNTVLSYTPWLLPEFRPLRDMGAAWQWSNVALDHLPNFIDGLAAHLQALLDRAGAEERKALAERLLGLLPEARRSSVVLIQNLRRIAAEADKLANEMDFEFLLSPRRKLLSIGFDAQLQQLQSSCYDLLASEARTAVFVAIAKSAIPQESWFLLGRPQTLDHGRPILVSWTGTMFEYLMPTIWMRTYPGTLLERSCIGAVRAQQAHTRPKQIPWGISESAGSELDDAGNHCYFAFGLARLALQKDRMKALVISPYSTFLALQADAAEALENLRRMSRLGWVGPYGFYESADFTSSRRSWRRHYELVRCWMAHHQGMSLLSTANYLYDGLVQHWFHREPRIQATELLLQEKPVAYVRPPFEKYGTTAA